MPERPLPAGYSLATGDTAAREQAAYVVIQDAFDEWEGRVRESFEDWAATTVRRPGAQPWQLRVVEHDGVVVGASFTILDSQGVGYVHQLAVQRSHRGKGLAQALLADAFGRARERGATRSELSTDSRTGALDLYLKMGMEVTQTWTHLVDGPAPLRPASGAEGAHERDVLVTGVVGPGALEGGPGVVLGAADGVGEAGALALHVALGRLLVQRVELQLGVVARVARERLDVVGSGV